jgi:mRNA-degrading endonuclease RelE of RelBE toxin-antitoxin system
MQYTLVVPIEFEIILKKLKHKKPDVFKLLSKKIERVVSEPILGKPLRNVLRNYRRVHLDPFVFDL